MPARPAKSILPRFAGQNEGRSGLFAQRHNRNLIQAAGTTLALIFHQTVYNLRTEHRNALMGLLLTISQTGIFILAFMGLYLVIGLRSSPIRADFMLFIMSGIIPFMAHIQTVAGVAASPGMGSGVARHKPLNPAVLIAASALAALYRQAVTVAVILWGYHIIISPIRLENPIGCLAMFLLAWFSGACAGLVFLGLQPWAPKGAKLLTTAYQRVNMIASGKMFVANTLPGLMLPWFLWNPLFHIIDQLRGHAFINYTPQKTDPFYGLWFSLAAMMIGLLLNFAARKYESLSWSAAR